MLRFRLGDVLYSKVWSTSGLTMKCSIGFKVYAVILTLHLVVHHWYLCFMALVDSLLCCAGRTCDAADVPGLQ